MTDGTRLELSGGTVDPGAGRGATDPPARGESDQQDGYLGLRLRVPH